MHGYGSLREEMLPHAEYLHRAGYNALLFDFRAGGESDGDAVTIGGSSRGTPLARSTISRRAVMS